ncbi:hypothetical protein [Nocardia sp. XZ_19_385]|uniref:hypothetical protein n=1 Tax=Nocardia sp. XZ_19_385 TaxID=2769488 RepID=UPI00188F9905|nr:hypothetical protein [Nocardia sp. XZ_19_385]
MSVELAGLITALAGNALAVVGLGLRLRWKAVRQKECRLQMVELAQVLPEHSTAESQDGPGGLHIKMTVGRATERDR